VVTGECQGYAVETAFVLKILQMEMGILKGELWNSI
jgi:hypothetical protein